jgi:hypothetical protein
LGTPVVPDDALIEVAEAYRQHGSTGGARALNMNRQKFEWRCRQAVLRGFLRREDHPNRPKASEQARAFSAPALPDEDISVDELVEHRIKQFRKKREANDARKCVEIKVKIKGPIGIQWFGDPHLDDDGTDIEAIAAHTDLVNDTEGLFAANVGDTTNNWTGRLARLYAQQGTTAKQAWMLAEWFIRRCPWLVIIGGNHDLWSGAGDPLTWIARGQTFMHEPSEARFALNFPSGARFIVNARHDFSGHSQWNPAHGAMKSAQLGPRDHLHICGHKHVSGYGITKDPASGRVSHSLQIGSYKLMDRYAKERGFRDQMIGPCALTVIDPSKPEDDGDMCKVFWNPYEGADYLKFKRRGIK